MRNARNLTAQQLKAVRTAVQGIADAKNWLSGVATPAPYARAPELHECKQALDIMGRVETLLTQLLTDDLPYDYRYGYGKPEPIWKKRVRLLWVRIASRFGRRYLP